MRMPAPMLSGTFGRTGPRGTRGRSSTRTLFTLSMRRDRFLCALHEQRVELLVVVLGPAEAVVFDLQEVQIEGLLLGLLEEAGEAALLPADRGEIAIERALDVADLGQDRALRLVDAGLGGLHLVVVRALARADEGLALALRVDVLRPELLEQRARQELGGGQLARVVDLDLGDLVAARRDLFALGADGREELVQLPHLLAEHARPIVERRGEEIVVLLVVVEVHLGRLQLALELLCLAHEPAVRGRRRLERDVDVLLHVVIDDSQGCARSAPGSRRSSARARGATPSQARRGCGRGAPRRPAPR